MQTWAPTWSISWINKEEKVVTWITVVCSGKYYRTEVLGVDSSMEASKGDK